SDSTFRSQLEVTRDVLGEIGALDLPSYIILNKRDRLSDVESQSLRAEYPEAILLSTRDSADLHELREKLLRFFEKDMQETRLTVPYEVQGAIGEIRRAMRVLEETYDERGVTLLVRAHEEDLARVRNRYKLSQ